MRACRSCWALLALITVFLSANFLQAETIALTAVDRGYYEQSTSDSGYHDPSTLNYLAGRYTFSYTGEYRNFFVFDLTDVAGSILSAKLKVNVLGVSGGTQEYILYDVATAVGTVTAGGYNQTEIFTDLGDGPTYGTCSIDISQADTFVEIPLNGDFVMAANGITGLFAIGGALTLDGGSSADQYVFGSADESPLSYTQLIVEVPEPSTLLLAILGLAGLLAFRRR